MNHPSDNSSIHQQSKPVNTQASSQANVAGSKPVNELRQNLIKARSHIVFLFGLCMAFGLVITLELWQPGNPESTTSRTPLADVLQASADRPAMPVARELTPIERKWAMVAWSFFENNVQKETGLVNSTDNYTATTLWDQSSYLLGMISANKLGILDDDQFYLKTTALLNSLATLDLFDGRLPNKSYNTKTLAMVDYNNQPVDAGIGWSAIDIARFMVPVNYLVWNHPEFTSSVKQVVERWDLSSMVVDAQLIGARMEEGDSGSRTADRIEHVQEGRLGYEEYAAKAVALSGWDASTAMSYHDDMQLIEIFGVDIATDSRNPEVYEAHNYVVSEPYVLDGIEFGWDQYSAELAWRIYSVQLKRYETTGILTAVSEDNIDQEPHFVYNTIFSDGKKWNAITEAGEDASEFRTLSTKAAFGLHVLFESGYTKKLMDRLHDNYDEQRGWYSGIYENSNKPNAIITANTNGIVLESLSFRQFGPLLKKAGSGLQAPAKSGLQVAESP